MTRSRWARVRRALALTCAIVAGSCGSSTVTRAESASSGATATTTSGGTAGRGTVAGTPGADKATQGDPLPPCVRSDSYTTYPDWLPTHIPDGFTLWQATTTVGTAEPGLPVPAGSATFGLIGTVDGHAAVIELDRNPAYAIDQRAGYGPDGDDPALSAVRGHPGSISHWINRGGDSGQVALWSEGGFRWQATSGLSVTDLQVALAPLHLTASAVSDPTGRLQVLGPQPAPQAQVRRTSITLESASDQRAYVATIDPPTSGGTGTADVADIATIAPLPSPALTRIDGRLLITAGSMTTTFASVATLADGSTLILNDAPLGDFTLADVSSFVAGLGRTEPGDSRLTPSLLYPGGQKDPTDIGTYCVSGGP